MNNKITFESFLLFILLSGAAMFLLIYPIMAAFRIPYPFELEWMEGAMLDHVARVLDGKPLYVPPSIDFIPFIYTPLYYYVSACIASITGISFIPLRLVSFVSSILSFAAIFLIVSKETKNSIAAFLSTCLFAATFNISGAWFDIARVDSLFLAFFLWGIYFLRFRHNLISFSAAGVLLFLSYMTKQTALGMAIPLLLVIPFTNRKLSLSFILTYVSLLAASYLYLNHSSEGWFSFYAFELPRHHSWLKEMWVGFWTEYILYLAPAFVLSVGYIMTHFSERKNIFWIAVFIGVLGSAYTSRLHSGGYANALIPAYAVIAILFGLGYDLIVTSLGKARLLNSRYALSSLYILLIFQFFMIRYNPLKQIPSQNSITAGNQLVSLISGYKGDVYVPHHGYLGILAGKRSFANSMAAADILRSNAREKQILVEEITNAITNRSFGAIILDKNAVWFNDVITKYYVDAGAVFDTPNVFIPVTGYPNTPDRIYIPKKL